MAEPREREVSSDAGSARPYRSPLNILLAVLILPLSIGLAFLALAATLFAAVRRFGGAFRRS